MPAVGVTEVVFVGSEAGAPPLAAADAELPGVAVLLLVLPSSVAVAQAHWLTPKSDNRVIDAAFMGRHARANKRSFGLLCNSVPRGGTRHQQSDKNKLYK